MSERRAEGYKFFKMTIRVEIARLKVTSNGLEGTEVDVLLELSSASERDMKARRLSNWTMVHMTAAIQ